MLYLRLVLRVKLGGIPGRGQRHQQPSMLHRLILQDGATMLGEMCKSGGKSDAISITDVSPEIFRHLLYYVYGGKIPDDG